MEKKSKFSEVLGQNVTGNKVLSFRLLGRFFLKLYGGAAKTVSENKITGFKKKEEKNHKKLSLKLVGLFTAKS